MLNGALIYAKYPSKEPVMEPGTIAVPLFLKPPLSPSLSPGTTQCRAALLSFLFYGYGYFCVFPSVYVRERFKSVGVARHVVYTQILRVYKTVAWSSLPTVGSALWSISCNEEVKNDSITKLRI